MKFFFVFKLRIIGIELQADFALFFYVYVLEWKDENDSDLYIWPFYWEFRSLFGFEFNEIYILGGTFDLEFAEIIVVGDLRGSVNCDWFEVTLGGIDEHFWGIQCHFQGEKLVGGYFLVYTLATILRRLQESVSFWIFQMLHLLL